MRVRVWVRVWVRARVRARGEGVAGREYQGGGEVKGMRVGARKRVRGWYAGRGEEVGEGVRARVEGVVVGEAAASPCD